MVRKILARIRLISRFVGYGASFGDSIRVLFAYGRAWALPKFGLTPHSPIRVTMRIQDRVVPIYFREFCDFCVFEEIFIKEEYAAVKNEANLPILDAGANVGFTSIYFALRFPGVPIYAFEPDPGAFALLSRNTSTFSEITAIEAALGESDGTATFYSVPGSAMSSSFVKRPRAQAVSVTVRSISSWMNEQGLSAVGVLKIDVEGFEDRILLGIGDTQAISEYIAEVHFDLMDKPKAWFIEILSAHAVTYTMRSDTRAILYAKRK